MYSLSKTDRDVSFSLTHFVWRSGRVFTFIFNVFCGRVFIFGLTHCVEIWPCFHFYFDPLCGHVFIFSLMDFM